MKILLLCHYDPSNAATVIEHINAIVKYSAHDIFVYTDLVMNNGDIKFGSCEIKTKINKYRLKSESESESREFALQFDAAQNNNSNFDIKRIQIDLDDFDAIIIHYSIFIAIEQYLSIKSRRKIAEFQGVKVVFLQDEYRFVDRSINAMHELGMDVVLTCVPEHSIEAVYPAHRMGDIHVVNTLTGYPSDFLSVLAPKPLKNRKYHVCYRGRRYPDWHGRMGREKFEIGEKFKKYARKYNLRTNISSHERDRVYGADWVNLIQNARAVLGVESGASVFDFEGDISTRTETMRSLLGKKGISYEELRQRFFAHNEGQIDLAQISPRVFEAICLRTLCILYEGNYSGILLPDVHYLSLKKDFSNIDHVCKRLRDDVFVAEIVANAYSKIAQGQTHTYHKFVRMLDKEVDNAKKRKRNQDDTHLKDMKKNHKNEINSFRYIYDLLHPFYMQPYPHALSVRPNISSRFIKGVAAKLPSGVRAKLKFLVK